ncbi:VOC family protein [Xylanimonas protaetiae]|uniref:VOC family protein n=1 Tax=Xylanimonas protaetiae TaxID=2509457 RepID=A0A4P6F724_9MICO|nr:VOC family protein [Xylanimonas protaetiae]QAY70149.1 VOC family protein [Xylanimonas protaetiae]
MDTRIAADTAMGAVTLRVADLDRMIAYYTQAVPLRLLAHDGPRAVLGRGTTAVLGRGTTAVVVLEHAPGLRHASPGEAGLFHTAILFDTQAALAAAVASVATRAPGTFTGSADHLVSQAFYFTDPEGNGVELYWDRDRSLWSWTHGQVEMATLFLDLNGYLREHLDEAGAADPHAGAARVGHVHLSVGDIASARRFYVDQLGFDATASLGGSALFVSAGGYHHHLAMNTWNSAGAGRRARTLGLGQLDLVLPTGDDVGALADRMRFYGAATADDGQTLAFEDPWANTVRVVAAGA